MFSDRDNRAAAARAVDQAGIERVAFAATQGAEQMTRAHVAPGEGKLDFRRTKQNDIHMKLKVLRGTFPSSVE